jgi:hypothetical protein
MAIVQYQVEVGATYATLTTVVSNVQNVSLKYGREKPLENYSSNTANVVLRYPTGYTSPNALFVTGTWVRISVRRVAPGFETYRQLFVGRITDVIVNYGIPYSGGVGNADFVTLTCEGNFAAFGRVQGNNYAMTAGTLSAQAGQCTTQTGLNISTSSGFGGTQSFPATTISSTWGDWVNRAVLTMNGRLIDISDGILMVNAYYKFAGFYGNFSDTTNDASNHSFEQIAFTSLADSFYTQVTVDPESFAAATVQTGSAPYRTYLVNTFNASTSQATDFANYLLSTYSTATTRILSVTCNLNAQEGDIPSYGMGEIGSTVTVTFRGVTLNCVIEGATFSGNPTQSSATFYLSAQDLNNYLTLNDAVYGKLDNNKLGY